MFRTSKYRVVSETVDHYSVIRSLIRYGCDLTSVEPTVFCRKWLIDIDSDLTNIVDWANFLCDQGLDANFLVEEENTLLTSAILTLTGADPAPIHDVTTVVLVLCLLKTDVCFREPNSGMQALHLLLGSNRSDLTSSQFEDLAYILIRYGGADISATTYDGSDPFDFVEARGWQNEWESVLLRCKIDIKSLLSDRLQRRHRSCYVGVGDSTAVDTDDMPPICSETVARRKPVVGDRLLE